LIPVISVLADAEEGLPGSRLSGPNDSSTVVTRAEPARAQKVWRIA
jgi:hypothetical protein